MGQITFVFVIAGAVFGYLTHVQAAEQPEFNPFAPNPVQVAAIVPQPGEIKAPVPDQTRVIDNTQFAALPVTGPVPYVHPAPETAAAPVAVPTPRPAPVKVAQAKKPSSANRLPPITPSPDDEMVCDLGHDLICAIQERLRRK